MKRMKENGRRNTMMKMKPKNKQENQKYMKSYEMKQKKYHIT